MYTPKPINANVLLGKKNCIVQDRLLYQLKQEGAIIEEAIQVNRDKKY